MVLFLLCFIVRQGFEFSPYQHFEAENMLGTDLDVSYEVRDNCVHVLHNGKISGVLAKKYGGTSRSSRDVLNTILLPDSMGGVVSPNRFAYNSIDDKIYIIGTDMQNIAVCDAQTGERISTVLTGKETMDLAYSETNDKVYCSVYCDSTLLVINGTTDSIVKIIPLQDYPWHLVWNSSTNELYCAFENVREIAVIDCVADTITLTIPLGGTVDPWEMLFNPLTGKIYCACHYAVNTDSLVVIDGNAHSVIATIPVSRGNFRLALNSNKNKIYCVSTRDDNVAIIDGLGDSLITTIDLGGGPRSVAYNPVMNRFYIGHLETRDVCVVDGNTDQVIATVYLGDEAWAMTFDSLDNRIFVAGANETTVYDNVIVVDCNTNTIVDRLPVGFWPRGIFWEKTYNQVWVGNTGAHDFPTYTTDGYSADSLEHCFKTVIGYTPYASTMNIASNKFYSVGHDDRYLLSLEIGDPGSPSFHEVGSGPWDVLFNPLENKIYSANRWSNTVTIIEGVTDSILANVPTDSEPVIFALNQADNKIYVCNLMDASLTVIDGHADSVLGTISVGNRPIPVLWNPIGNKIYCGNAFDNTVTVVDAQVDTVITTIPVGDTPYALAHSPTNNKIYCANFHSDDVTIINATTDEVITTVYMGSYARPYTFAYNIMNNKVYCANIIDSSISIIDGATDSIVKTIPIPAGPFSLLYNPITNKVFCAYIDTDFPWWHQALAVIGGVSDSIITVFSLNAQVWYYGVGSPQKALVLDSLRNIVYYSHYQANKISVIDGETDVHEMKRRVPTVLVLNTWPNPAQRSVRILYSVPFTEDVRLAVYDISGRVVRNLECPASQESVSNQVIWDGTDNTGHSVAAGVYFVRLETPRHKKTKKVIFLR